jgi:hypothetical protein
MKRNPRKILGIPVTYESKAKFQQGLDERARQFAADIKTPFWGNGPVLVLPLPSMPSDGSTQCSELHRRCNCKWDVHPVDLENGDFDVHWLLGPDADDIQIDEDVVLERGHCQTCIIRSEDWNPIRIRNWTLLL